MKEKSTGIVVIGAAFVDIKGYPYSQYIPTGRNSGFVVEVHGGVGRNIVEDIANVELRPSFVTVLDKRVISTEVADKLSRHRLYTAMSRATSRISILSEGSMTPLLKQEK